MKGKGLWINASDEDYHALQGRVEGLGTLGHEFADWGSKEVLNTVKSTNYTPPPGDNKPPTLKADDLKYHNIHTATSDALGEIGDWEIGVSGDSTEAQTAQGNLSVKGGWNEWTKDYKSTNEHLAWAIGKYNEELAKVVGDDEAAVDKKRAIKEQFEITKGAIHAANETGRKTANYINSQLGLSGSDHRVYTAEDAYSEYVQITEGEYENWKAREQELVEAAIKADVIDSRDDAKFKEEMMKVEEYKEHIENKPKTEKTDDKTEKAEVLSQGQWEANYVGYGISDDSLI